MFMTTLANITMASGILLILGLILVIVEMCIPGFGVPGISGAILLIIGIILTAESAAQALILGTIILVILSVVLGVVIYLVSKGKLKGIILKDKLDKVSGYSSTENLDYFLGKEGITLTVLRPSGTADFDGEKLDVVSECEYLEKGTSIKVIKIDGRKVLVRSTQNIEYQTQNK